MALERLGVNSNKAIAFEDSAAGIRSAVNAGIYTIGITSTHPDEELLDAGASLAIKDFTNPKLWELLDSKVFSS